MSLNRLIALGGRGVKSPAERFIETKGQMERGRLRQVQEQGAYQNIGLKGQQAEQQGQERQMIMMGRLAKGVLDSENKPEAYKQARSQLSSMGVDTTKIPPEYAPEYDAGLMQMVEMAGMELDEKWEQVTAASGAPAQQSTTSGLQKPAVETDQVKALKNARKDMLYNDQVVPGIVFPSGVVVNADTGEPMPGATFAPTKQETGEPGSFMGDKDLVKLTEKRRINEQTLYKSVHAMNRLEQLVANENFIGGITGDAVSMVNSLTSQAEQLMGLDSIVDENNNIKESEVDPASEQFTSLRKKAIQNDKYSAALIELAYVKAKLVDPASKITDKDFDFARKMLASGADKASIINTLRMQSKLSKENYNQEEMTAKGRFDRYVPSPYTEDKYRSLYNISPPVQLDESSTPDDFARDWLQSH